MLWAIGMPHLIPQRFRKLIFIDMDPWTIHRPSPSVSDVDCGAGMLFSL